MSFPHKSEIVRVLICSDNNIPAILFFLPTLNPFGKRIYVIVSRFAHGFRLPIFRLLVEHILHRGVFSISYNGELAQTHLERLGLKSSVLKSRNTCVLFNISNWNRCSIYRHTRLSEQTDLLGAVVVVIA